MEEENETAIETEEEFTPDHLKEESPLRDKEMEIPRRNERPMVKRRREAEPWDCAMDLSGGFSRQNMLNSTLIETKGPNLVFLEDFKKARRCKIIYPTP